jgi:integrase
MTKRQFGTVRKLPSGRWQVRYRDGSGRRITAPDTFATKGEAGRFLATVETDMARGQYLDPRAGRLTLSTWVEEWLGRAGKKPASVARDRQALYVFMPALGALPLAAITPSHVQTAVDARAKLAAPSTVVRDFAPLRAVLTAAVDADLIGRSPARRVALPRARPPDRDVVAPEALISLVAETPEHYRVLVLTAGVLGLRWGEAVGLRVRDVDFMRRTVTVAQVVEELSGHLRIVPEPKSRASLRTMAAPTFLVDELARHLVEHRSTASGGLDALIFLGPHGGVLRRRFGERILRPAAARAGLAGLTFHGLRHAAVSALVDEGVHPRVMAARAGHDTARLTLELYAHVSDSADREAANALQGRFGRFFSLETGTGGAREGHEGRLGGR